MQSMKKILRGLGVVLGALALCVVAVFSGLQTQFGKAWLAREIGQMLGDPDFTVGVEGLQGFVPFHMTVERIEIGDRDGTYLRLLGAGLDLAASALLTGKIHIRSLKLAEADMARLTTAPSTTPFIHYLKVPHVPLPVILDRLAIGRLALAPPVLGESIVATVEGNAELAGAEARANLDLHRIDSTAGKILLALELAGDTPVLSLRLDADEPAGVVLDRLLARTDHLPLALSVAGNGPLADWHGRMTASAGALGKVAADLTIAAADETVLGVSGTAGIAPLLPAEIAPLVGEQVVLSAHAAFGTRIVLDPLSIEIAAGRLTGRVAYGGPEHAVAAELRAVLPELSAASALVGQPLGGSAALSASVTGTESQPSIELNVSGNSPRIGSSGAEHIEATLWAKPMGVLDNPETRIDLAGTGRMLGLVVPEGVALPPELVRDLDWSFAATVARDGKAVDLTRFSAQGAGAALAASGQMTESGAIEGRTGLTVADLRPFSGFVGHSLAGSLEIEANAERQGVAGFTATVGGTAKGLSTGIAAADALLGGAASINASIERDADEVLKVDRLVLASTGVSLSGNGRFVPASNELTAALAVDLPRLKPLGAIFGAEATGTLSARADIAGPLDHLTVNGDIDAGDVAVAGAKLDQLRLTARIQDLSTLQASVDGSFRAGGLDGRLALAAERRGDSELVLPHFRLAAANTNVEGALRLALDTGLVRGSVAGRSADLSPWSKLAGTPLGGSFEFGVGLDARGGQLVDLSANGTNLAAGTGSSRIGLAASP